MSTAYPQQAEETFAEIVTLLGMSATTTSESRERGIYIKVDTPEPGRLIGRKGQTLHSIQYLLNVMVQRRDSEFPRVFIDLADDARRKPRRRNDDNDGERGERRDRRERSDRNDRSERGDRRNGDRRRRDDRSNDNRDERPNTNTETDAPAAAAEPKKEPAAAAPEATPAAAAPAQASSPSVDAVVEPAIERPAASSSSDNDDDWRPSDPAPARQPRREPRPERSERRRGDLSPEEKARKQTADAIKEVRRWGESVKMPPLTVEMRKVVLEVLDEHKDVVMEGELDEHVERKRVTLQLKS